MTVRRSVILAVSLTIGFASGARATRDCNPSGCADVIGACETANGCAAFQGAAKAACVNFCRKSTVALCKDDPSVCAGTPATTTTSSTEVTTSTTTTTLECTADAAPCGSCGGASCRPHCGVPGEPLICRATVSHGICASDADCPAGDICTSDSGTCTDCAPGDCICTAPCP